MWPLSPLCPVEQGPGAVSESSYWRAAWKPLKIFCKNDFELEGTWGIIVAAKNESNKRPQNVRRDTFSAPDPELCHNLSIESGTAAASSQPCMLNGELTETQNLFQLPSSSALGHGTWRQSNIWEYFHINRGVSTQRPAEQPSTVIKYFNPQVTRQGRGSVRRLTQTMMRMMTMTHPSHLLHPWLVAVAAVAAPVSPAGANDDITLVLSRATHPETCWPRPLRRQLGGDSCWS